MKKIDDFSSSSPYGKQLVIISNSLFACCSFLQGKSMQYGYWRRQNSGTTQKRVGSRFKAEHCIVECKYTLDERLALHIHSFETHRTVHRWTRSPSFVFVSTKPAAAYRRQSTHAVFPAGARLEIVLLCCYFCVRGAVCFRSARRTPRTNVSCIALYTMAGSLVQWYSLRLSKDVSNSELQKLDLGVTTN